LHCIGTGVRDSSEGYALAELSSGGEQYVLRATRCIKQYDAIVVHADRPNRWESSDCTRGLTPAAIDAAAIAQLSAR
jgi:hypothetical protein